MLKNRWDSRVLPWKIRNVYGMASMVVPYGSEAGRIGGWYGCEGWGGAGRAGGNTCEVARKRLSFPDASLKGLFWQPSAKAGVKPLQGRDVVWMLTRGFAPGYWRRRYRPRACGS